MWIGARIGVSACSERNAMSAAAWRLRGELRSEEEEETKLVDETEERESRRSGRENEAEELEWEGIGKGGGRFDGKGRESAGRDGIAVSGRKDGSAVRGGRRSSTGGKGEK